MNRHPRRDVECPHCGDTFDPVDYCYGDPHPDLDELTDESSETHLTCAGCGEEFVVYFEPIWQWRTEKPEDAL